MHITLWFEAPGGGAEDAFIRVPRSNLHLFQSLIYSVLPPDRAAFLHDEGYRVYGRRMKLFAMSWPIAARLPSFEAEAVRFPLPVRLVISTPVTDTMDGVAGGALAARELRIGNNVVLCSRVLAEQQWAEEGSLTVRTLSPISCYSQTEREGRPYTVYLTPEDPAFVVSVRNNLLRKFRALYPDREPPSGDVSVKPLGRVRERAALFSPKTRFPIKGWDGRFRLEGPQELLQVALDCGLGAKNSAGWGCVTKEPEAERRTGSSSVVE